MIVFDKNISVRISTNDIAFNIYELFYFNKERVKINKEQVKHIIGEINKRVDVSIGFAVEGMLSEILSETLSCQTLFKGSDKCKIKSLGEITSKIISELENLRGEV